MEPLTPEEVAGRLAARQVEISAEEAEALAGFLNLLEQWNRVHNLTGITDRDDLIDRHLVESLALRSLVAGPTAADVGSGGGLPGVPLAIARPDVAFTLIESRRKRCSFLRHVAATLGLGNVQVEHARAEDVAGTFATVLARAVAPPAELLALTRSMVAPGGRLVLLTGEDKARETIRLAEGFVEIDAALSGIDIRSHIVVLERV